MDTALKNELHDFVRIFIKEGLVDVGKYVTEQKLAYLYEVHGCITYFTSYSEGPLLHVLGSQSWLRPLLMAGLRLSNM